MGSKLPTEYSPLVEAVFVFAERSLCRDEDIGHRKKVDTLRWEYHNFSYDLFSFRGWNSFVGRAFCTMLFLLGQWYTLKFRVGLQIGCDVMLACFSCVGFMSWEVWEACVVNK